MSGPTLGALSNNRWSGVLKKMVLLANDNQYEDGSNAIFVVLKPSISLNKALSHLWPSLKHIHICSLSAEWPW